MPQFVRRLVFRVGRGRGAIQRVGGPVDSLGPQRCEVRGPRVQFGGLDAGRQCGLRDQAESAFSYAVVLWCMWWGELLLDTPVPTKFSELASKKFTPVVAADCHYFGGNAVGPYVSQKCFERASRVGFVGARKNTWE